MEWLIIGAILGMAGLWLAWWALDKGIRVKWYVWILIVLAVLMAALTAMDYITLTVEMEPGAAGVILWLFGGPALILALIAASLVWWQNKRTIRALIKR